MRRPLAGLDFGPGPPRGTGKEGVVNIGEERRTIYIEPIEEPAETPISVPIEEPVPEPVGPPPGQ
jgi:hypothetical protein